MQNWTDWRRIELDPYDRTQWSARQIAEEETTRDLKKPIQQLICDMHEEILETDRPGLDGLGPMSKKVAVFTENQGHATKKMAAVMARLALENKDCSEKLMALTEEMKRRSRTLLQLTHVLAFLTLVLLLLGLFQNWQTIQDLWRGILLIWTV
jgi:hypothetical protein